MSIQTRLAGLEKTIRPEIQDRESPCEVCGAPESTFVFREVHLIRMPDPDYEPKCPACKRWLNDATGQPIKAQQLVCLIRGTPPEGWNSPED